MSTDTVSASARNARAAALLLEVAAGLAGTAAALATTTKEKVTSPQEVLRFAAGLLELNNPNTAPDHSDNHNQGDELDRTREELGHARRFAVDAHELLDQAATQLTALQEQEWDYDRAAWLEQARPLLAANPYYPSAHLPEGHPRLIEADRLRVAAYTIQVADALQVAARAGNPTLLGRAVAVYEHARRLYAHATTGQAARNGIACAIGEVR